MDAGPGVFAHLESRWELTRVDNPNGHVLRGYSHNSGEPTPSWWSPDRANDETLFFACPQTLGGEKGPRFQIALDREQDTVFVHYWFNF